MLVHLSHSFGSLVILLSWAVSLEVSCFATSEAPWEYFGIGGWSDVLRQGPTETDGMPFLVAVFTVYLPASPIVMEATLVTLWE